MPDLDINKCVYIYARIDSTDLVIETNESNNESSVSNAACILLYNDEEGSRTYNLIFETFPPTGSGSTNTLIALYKDNGATMDYVADNDDDGSYTLYSKITQTCDKQSIYYLVVVAYDPGGPYAFSVRTSDVAIRLFSSDLGSNGDDPGEDDDDPTPFPFPGNIARPPVSTSINAGATSNRYAPNNDWDWFKIELP